MKGFTKMSKDEYRKFTDWIALHGEELYQNKIAYEVRWQDKDFYVRLCDENNYKLNELTTDKISKLTSNEIKKFTFSYVTKNYNYDRVLNNYLLPVLLVNYTREYYEINSEIRVTLDSNLNFRNISSEHPVTYHNKMMYNQYIMEIKFGVNQKYIVSDLIRYLNLTPKRHSKYLVGMAKIGFVNYV